MGKKEFLIILSLVAVVGLWLFQGDADFQRTPGVDRVAEDSSLSKRASFQITTNGRPERLDDLVVSARFTSPEPVRVGYYSEDKIVTRLRLSIDRFDWEFQQDPIKTTETNEDGSVAMTIAKLQVIDNYVMEDEKNWQFVLSELHCENRDMLERLFSGCEVTVSVEAMVGLEEPGVNFNRVSSMIEAEIKLPALSSSAEELLRLEEERIQRDSEIWIKDMREKELIPPQPGS